MNALYFYLRRHQGAILVSFSLVVAAGVVSYIAANVGFPRGSAESFDRIQEGITYIVNVLTVLLLWFAFENMRRIDRESERIQDFGDTLHREMRR